MIHGSGNIELGDEDALKDMNFATVKFARRAARFSQKWRLISSSFSDEQGLLLRVVVSVLLIELWRVAHRRV